MERVPIAVIEKCDEQGNITPLKVVYGGAEYEVERVRSIRRYAPRVACLSPMRYDCVICGREKVIYRDAYPSQKWFSVRP